MKRIAILGSSGGNLYNLGGKDPGKLLGEIISQVKSAGFQVAAIQFIAAEISMDKAKDCTKAGVYLWDEIKEKPIRTYDGLLKDSNSEVTITDNEIAEKIRKDEIDGLITMSIDPKGANKEAILAAIEKKIPIVGTGGTSMAMISSKGGNVIATSGTTGTTNRTRAVSFITSLSKHWGHKYKPLFGETSVSTEVSGNPFKAINLKGIMQASMPGFIAMAIVLAASQVPVLHELNKVFEIMLKALPVILAAIAAKQVSNLDEISIVAGVIAGTLSIEGGIVGGIIGGIGAGLLVRFLFSKSVQWRFPITTANIIAGGFGGLLSGLMVYYLVAPFALQAGNFIKLAINSAVEFNPLLAGIVAGVLIWPAILGGVYHAAILPIVLLEMETTGNSFLGAIDMVGLVMVAAGINLANIISPRDRGEAAVATPGFLINLGFGTFVESAYPFMFSNKLVFAGSLFSAALGGAVVGFFNVRGTAYVPSFMSPLLSTNMVGLIFAMVSSLLCACIITLIANKMSKSQIYNNEKDKNTSKQSA
ncbi:PTS sugar transporter [Peribacillus frigoritolerans]|uniref:PTS sugar transporter n=1 Tax=Peribacillus frigoritolerans TaxID=450367 RepID=UPI003F8183A1